MNKISLLLWEAGKWKRWILMPLPPLPLQRSLFHFHKNVVISLVANPPTNAEAAGQADRFRFRFRIPVGKCNYLRMIIHEEMCFSHVLYVCIPGMLLIGHVLMQQVHPLLWWIWAHEDVPQWLDMEYSEKWMWLASIYQLWCATNHHQSKPNKLKIFNPYWA